MIWQPNSIIHLHCKLTRMAISLDFYVVSQVLIFSSIKAINFAPDFHYRLHCSIGTHNWLYCSSEYKRVHKRKLNAFKALITFYLSSIESSCTVAQNCGCGMYYKPCNPIVLLHLLQSLNSHLCELIDLLCSSQNRLTQCMHLWLEDAHKTASCATFTSGSALGINEQC